MEDTIKPTTVLAWIASVLVGLGLIIAVVLGGWFAVAAVGRYQRLADEQNQVQINDIQIAQTAQLVQVEKQKAEVRVADANGIAQSQAIIAGSLSPAYLQYLAIQAQIDMAQKSDHSATIYIPVGPNGIPVVVTQPAQGK